MVQWLIRNDEGEIKGPLTTVEVIRQIRSGVVNGEEYISRFPEGRWFPISYDQNFFNVLLEVLEQELSEAPDDEPVDRDEVTKRIENLKKEYTDAQNTRQAFGQAVFEDVEAQTPIVIEMEKAQSDVGRAVVEDKPSKKKTTKGKKTTKKKTVKKLSRRQRRTRLQLLVLASISLLVFAVFEYIQPKYKAGTRLRLQRPQFTKNGKLSQREIQENLRRAIIAFRKDNRENYMVAQDALVSAVRDPKSLNAFGYLCMVYRELWPFTYQDAIDHKTVQTVLKRIQKLSPTHLSANICLVVSHWIKGEYDDALRIMDSQLSADPTLIFFNHMVGDIHAARKDYRTASYYFSRVRELWSPPPVWSKALLQEARMYRKRNVFGAARKLYRALLKQNPGHSVAKIELGIIEFEPYQQINKSKDSISSGLSSGQFIPKMIHAEGLVTLAKISIMQGDNRQGLLFAKDAFSVDSSNEEAREMIISMGGIKTLNSIKINNVNMVYLGEQYMKMNNFPSAQAEFRAAFLANPRNGFAALRAGEALWRLGQSNDAINWVKKSIEADPNFIRSYLILADYQSARFDYINAVETLKGALRINPRHHGVYRGFALVELRRRNYPGAVKFCKKALELYDTDIDSLVIMAKALNEQNNPEEANQFLRRALEMDSSNEEVHKVYARIIANLQGTDEGIRYMEKIVDQTGKTTYLAVIGQLLTREERFSEAIQFYYQALEKNPNDKRILMDLANVYRAQKRYTEARDLLLDAAAQDPTNAEPLFVMGELYLSSGDFLKARDFFKKVLKVNKNYPLAHFYAGKAHIALKEYSLALKMADQEKFMNPNIPEPYMLAGETYFKSRRYKLCAEEYQKVLKRGLVTAEVYINLARCYRLFGAYDSAMTMLTRAEATDNGNPEVHKELGALYQAQGTYIKAYEAYKQYLQLDPQAPDRKEIEREMKKMEE